MPVPPKPSGLRARRNRSSTAAVIRRDTRVRAPKLPEHPGALDGRDWHAQTLVWWKDIWHSPMAPEFDDSDKHGLFALAMLVDDFWTTGSARLRAQIGAEIRLQGVRFGLSPIDRRRLQWEIEHTEEAITRGRKRKAAEEPPAPVGPVEDARNVLRSVK